MGASMVGRPGVRAKRRFGTVAVQEALFEVEVRPERRYYRQILDVLARSDFGADPLASELVISKLFGTVWAAQEGPRDGATEEAFGLGLVEYARQRPRPTTVAVLHTVAVIAPILRVRAAAAQVAAALVAHGLPEPRWSPPAGAAVPGRCWVYEDVFGDHSTVICEFGSGADPRTAERHAIVVSVDHAMFSAAIDVMLTHDVDPLIRDLRNDVRNSGPMYSLSQIEPTRARTLLARAFTRTDLIEGLTVEPAYAELRAIAMARVDALPENVTSLAPEPGPPDADARRALVEEFLSSPSADALSDRDAARAVATRIVAFACVHEPGRVTRVGPAWWDTFVYDWLPREPALASTERAALPGVARAWSAWAGRRMDLPRVAMDELTAALDEILDDWSSGDD